MRKFLLGAAIAASALTAAVPAAAQYYPQQPAPYGYNGQNYGQYGNGQYNNGYGQGRALMARVDRVRMQIRMLDQRNILSDREAYRLNQDALRLRQRVGQLSYGGINPNERYDVERRLAQLEQRVQINAYDRDGRYDRGNRYGQGQYGQYGQNDGRWQDQNGNWHERD